MAKNNTKTTAKASKTKPEGEYGMVRSNDLPWCDKKVALFKALKALRATSEDKAKGSKEIAEKAGYTPRDIRHYGYHAAASGLVGICTVEGIHGHAFYLTSKGAGVNPDKELTAQEKAKAANKE